MTKKCIVCGKEVKESYVAVPVWNGVKYLHSWCDKPREIKPQSSPKKTSSRK